MLQSRSKLHTRDNGKRDRERDGDRCSVLVGDDILHLPVYQGLELVGTASSARLERPHFFL